MIKIFINIWVDPLGLSDLKGEGIPLTVLLGMPKLEAIYKTLNMKPTEIVEIHRSM